MRVSPSLALRLAVLCTALAAVSVAAPRAQAPAPDSPRAATKATLDRANQMLRDRNAIGAGPLIDRAIADATTAGDKETLQRAYFLKASARQELNDWAGSLDYAQRAYDAMPDPKGLQRARYLNIRGRVLQELRERDQALEAYLEGVEIAKAVHDRRLEGSFYNELGLLTWRFDRDRDKALAFYRQALAIDREVKEPFNEAVSLNNAGNMFRAPGTYPEAERMYREGLAAVKRAGLDGDAFLMKNLGIVLRDTGRRAEAEPMLQRAVQLADAGGVGRIQWQGRMELANFYSTVDVDRAAGYFEQTLEVLEGMNNNVLLEGFRAGALSGAVTIYDDPYDLYTDMLLAGGRVREAFLVSERARARAFLDTLSLARESIAAALPESFVQEEREILGRISSSQAALRKPDLAPTAREALRATIVGDEEKLAQLRLRLAAEHPGLADARYPKIWPVEDLQAKLLGPDEVLLQYFVGAKAGTLWIVTPAAMVVKTLPPRADIEAAVRGYLETLSTPQGDFTARSRTLGAMLLPGLDESVTAASRLIVVPHGILTYLPFETLQTARGQFLIQERAISYAPSSSSLAFLRSRPRSGDEVLALGNPVMRSGTAAERGRAADRVDLLKALPYSGAEVRAVSAVYGGAAHVFEQDDATELALRTPSASRAGIIHIATHGLIDEELPDRSGLALTARPPDSDGILQMREVYGLTLNARLVTLSACQTALGKSITGEGLIGLSRAFFYAGSNAVVASLWNVNDASTARLMRPFYESLSEGAAIDQALRSAKVALLDGGGRLAHPYFWAPFVVTGHGVATVPVRAASPWPTWTFAAVLTLVLGFATLAWRRVR